MIRRAARCLMLAGAVATITVPFLGQAAHAAGPWVDTRGVALGRCAPTVKLQGGLYMQACSRRTATGPTSVTFQNYVVIANTSRANHLIAVPDSQQHGDFYFWSTQGNILISSEDRPTGDCPATTLRPGQSLTCRSTGTTFVTGLAATDGKFVNTWGKVSVEADGRDRGWFTSPTEWQARGTLS